jgi:phage replication-related protein YjqB (UPF0714/DUF867 family)
MDRYTGFDDLRRSERLTDFAVRLRVGSSGIAVLAPHGGGIEPGASEIADAAAGGEHTFYAFEGLKPKGNRILHMASTRFDEPLGLGAALRARLVVTIHGCAETRALVHVGSRDALVRERFRLCLEEGGFLVEDHPLSALRGHHPDNLCNKGRKGLGVQLEVSRGLRKRMFGSLEPGGERVKTPVFDAFVTAVRRAIEELAACIS